MSDLLGATNLSASIFQRLSHDHNRMIHNRPGDSFTGNAVKDNRASELQQNPFNNF